MSGWIVVRHWEDFQAYNDRTVPWIRLYAELQHSDQWLQLPAGRRGMLTSLWLEYMFSRCRLPADSRELSRRFNARVRQDDIQALCDAGFIEVLSEPNPTHVRLASDKPRTSRAGERREEKRREEKTSPNGPVENIARVPAVNPRTNCTHDRCVDLEECYYE